jgi:carbonic anhydrase
LPRFDEILERNRRFTAGTRAELPPAPVSFPLIVVTCFEPKLDPPIPALGLETGEAFWFRTAGAFVPSASSTLRALMVAIFLFDAREILVVGHSSCRMASFNTSSFIDSFRLRGVPRDAFGTDDLREWAGAIPNARQGVELTVRNILEERVRPRELTISGAVLDDASARLSPVPVSSAASEAGDAVDAGTAKSELAEARKPVVPTEGTLGEAVDLLRGFLRESASLQQEVGDLRARLERETSVFAKLRLLTAFMKKLGADSQEILHAFELLKKQVRPSSNPTIEAEELVRVMEQILAQR